MHTVEAEGNLIHGEFQIRRRRNGDRPWLGGRMRASNGTHQGAQGGQAGNGSVCT
jgi:hypothetical protein